MRYLRHAPDTGSYVLSVSVARGASDMAGGAAGAVVLSVADVVVVAAMPLDGLLREARELREGAEAESVYLVVMRVCRGGGSADVSKAGDGGGK